MDIRIDLKNYDKSETVYKRTAARAVIKRGGQFLLIFSKYGDYKFPGGGVEKGESLEDALIREVKEETGYRVIRDSIRFYGKVFERGKGASCDLLEMDSHYFLCDVEDFAGDRKLDNYEEEYDYQAIWMSLDKSIEKNKMVSDLDTCPWVIRDTKVMEILEDERFFSVLPDEILNQIRDMDYKKDSLGRSGSHIFLFDNDLVFKAERKNRESEDERQMMIWLQGRLPVPVVKGFYCEEDLNYLLMTKIPGKMACNPDFLRDGDKLVKLLAKGLKMLWQVDISDCPRVISLDYKLERALEQINNNMVDMEDFEAFTKGPDGFESPMELYDYLLNHKPEENYVLVHGDYCLPNVFFDKDDIAGFIDLGFCGAADKWQDIALAVRSLRHNLADVGKESDFDSLYQLFFEELGLKPEEEKIRYYTLLDELF